MARFLRLFLVVFLIAGSAAAGEKGDVFVREDFSDIEDWKPLLFHKIERPSNYYIEAVGSNSVLTARSDNSASGLVYKKYFNVRKYPVIEWRWKIENVYQRGDATSKHGDDYPIRIYVFFEYEPSKANWRQRAKYGLARKIYGEYPPDSSLSYVWASRKQSGMLKSPYTDRAVIIPLRFGAGEAEKWLVEEVNILEDYRKAFGIDPPGRASLAIMNDSDNTGEESVSYVDYVAVRGEAAK